MLNKDIKEAWLSKEEELEADFKACGKTINSKADKVNKTKLPELLAEEVARIFFIPFLLYRNLWLLFLN